MIEREKMDLPCRLNPGEIEERAVELVARMDKVEALKFEAKSAAEAFKDKIGGETDRIKDLKTSIRRHEEFREVECILVPLASAHMMVTVRTDTGAEVSRRSMTDHERTPNLFEEKPANGETLLDEETDRIVKAVELSDMMKQLEVDLPCEMVFPLTPEQVGEAREWAVKALATDESGKRKKPPKFIAEMIKTAEEARAAAEEREQLHNRCLALLLEADLAVDEVAMSLWSTEQLNEASDYAQAKIDGKGEEELKVPEFLQPPPPKPEAGPDAASAEG